MMKRTMLISLLGHIAVFGIFTITLGERFSAANYTSVSFLGPILRSRDFISREFRPMMHSKITLLKFLPEQKAVAKKEEREDIFLSQPYFKPEIPICLAKEKILHIPQKEPIFPYPKKKESILMFYPRLPYHFLLYFKDRQKVHIELMFNLLTNFKTKTILIKRKISSGNLEADLLSMRYIGHYLFIQQPRFIPNKWQEVKIDLSAKDD